MVKFSIRKSKEIVALSGIKIGIQSLLGAHQAMITAQAEKKRTDGFENLLYDCIEYIGDKRKPELTLNDIKRLLEGDRKLILIKIRQLSNNDNPLFVFDYEFPTEEGQKLKERKTVNFNKENFPIKPYYWVRSEANTESQGLDQPGEESSADRTGWNDSDNIPVMFTDYSQILEAHLKQEFVLPECGIKVFYNLLTAEETSKYAGKLTKETINSHTQIIMRSPTYIDEDLSNGREKPVIVPVPLDQVTHIDIEALRKDIMEKEGNVETTVVVQYKQDRSKQSEIDLIAMPAFFFPSLVL